MSVIKVLIKIYDENEEFIGKESRTSEIPIPNEGDYVAVEGVESLTKVTKVIYDYIDDKIILKVMKV